MGVLTASTESSPKKDGTHRNNLEIESDCYSSSEETRLLKKEKVTPSTTKKLTYPKSVFFIIGNEFCERFNYYGLRTVLTIYLTQRLYYSDDTATMIYHLFTMLAYFTPVIGAIIADSWLGKFRTILYLSILYTVGSIVLSFGAFPNDLNIMKLITLVGLFVIGLGTGGIKPCVSAFGGDQFKEGQEEQLQKFFSIFYLSINLGSLISTFLTPILREDIHCLGEKTCFPVAFGVPSILMIVALIIFICGKPFYTIRPPEGNIVLKVAKCICHAVGRKCKTSEKKKAHWLDYADDKFDKKLIEDIKIVLKVFVLYIPLPLFWALFDQMGSRWTLQATRMDGQMGGYHIKADQMQVINPFLIIAFIPLFDYVVYPLMNKCHFLTTSLKRITAGGILAAVSFVIAGLIELNVEGNLPVLPGPGMSQITIINNSPCFIRISETNLPAIPAFESGVALETPLEQRNEWTLNPENCSSATQPQPLTFSFYSNTSIESMMISVEDGKLRAVKTNDTKTKAKDGEPKLRLFYNLDNPTKENISFILQNDKRTYSIRGTQEEVGITDYLKFTPGKYKIYTSLNDTVYQENLIAEGHFKSGGVYIVSVYGKSPDVRTMNSTTIYEMVKGNDVSILYQIPQYVIITAGEIMFSITGLEFSYSQSPNSMKSVVQAAWLLTVAFGNLIVLVIAKLKLFEKQSYELFLFAVLMGIDMIIFAILAFFYQYVTIKQDAEEGGISFSKENREELNGKSNDGYVEETDFNK